MAENTKVDWSRYMISGHLLQCGDPILGRIVVRQPLRDAYPRAWICECGGIVTDNDRVCWKCGEAR